MAGDQREATRGGNKARALGDWLQSHLAFSPHFSLHLQDSERLLLLSEERSFRLNGGIYAKLLPLLDGRLRGQEIIDRLSAVESPDRAALRLARMIEKGYVAVVDPDTDMAGQAYWSALGESPSAVSSALREFRLAIVPLGVTPASDANMMRELAAAVSDLGISVVPENSATLTLALCDDYLQPSLGAFSEACRSAGRRWLPFKPGGTTPWLGPVIGGAGGHCFACLTRGLLEHRPGDLTVDAPEAGVRPARAWLRQSLAAAGALAGLELARFARGADSRIADGLVTWALELGTSTVHVPPRFADCPGCGRPVGRNATEPVPIRIAVTVHSTLDGGWRTLSAVEALRRMETVVSPLTGIVDEVQELELGPGLFVCNARQAARLAIDPRANRHLGRPEGASGKGLTAAQARASCIAEAIERYACAWSGAEPRRLARLDDLGAAAVDPREVLHFSDHQFRNRESLNQGVTDAEIIPLPFDDAAEIEWVPAWSLRDDAPRWLPARYCYFGYEGHDVPGDHAFCYANSNGCAAGGVRDEAILQALLELIERDGTALWWYNRLQLPELSLEGVDDGFVERMLRHYARLGRDLKLLDLTTDFQIPTLVAVSVQADGTRPVLGMGAHLDPRIAALRALTELNQTLYFDGILDNQPQVRGEEMKAVREWFSAFRKTVSPYLRPRAGARRTISDLPKTESATIADGLRHCVETLVRRGHDVIVFDYDRRDLPLSCVRVVLPGVRHFWNRRGPGRLYDAPVRMGLLDAPLSEAELNPVNFVL